MFTTNALDYFNATTRIRSDQYDEAAKNIGNTSVLTRQMSGPTAPCSDTLSPTVAMADQPGMIAHGGWNQPGCFIDESTDLRWGIPGAWRQKGKHELWARPFATTPALKSGNPGSIDDESGLIHSAMIRNRKETNTIMDKMIPQQYAPLLPIQASELSNPNNWVQSWTWGGDSARLVHTKRVGTNE